MGMVERSPSRRIRLVAAPNIMHDILLDLLCKYVQMESIIYTDCSRSYNNVSSEFFAHFTVNHSRSFVDSETGTHTNTIERNWSMVKNKTPIRKRTSKFIDLQLVLCMIQRLHPNNELIEMLNFFFYFLLVSFC